MSELVNFIKTHPSWKQELADLHILIKQQGDLAIFNYTINADFFNPLVKEARGIIIDLNTLRPVCFPFYKFGNSHESYADVIDWKSARVQEKIDGSIIKLYFYNEQWYFATNSVIDAHDAPSNIGSFYDVIIKADNYGDIPFDMLNKDYTYIFEMVSPVTSIVIPYKKTHLYHIGTRNNITEQEILIDIGIEKPKEYPLSSLEECLTAAEHLNNLSNNYTAQDITHEGFVVVDKYFHRVKIKTPEYLFFHHFTSKPTYVEVIEAIFSDDIDFNQLVKYYEKYQDYLLEIKYDFDIALQQTIYYINDARYMFSDMRQNRKEFSKAVSSIPVPHIYFSAITVNLPAETLAYNIIRDMPKTKRKDYIMNHGIKAQHQEQIIDF